MHELLLHAHLLNGVFKTTLSFRRRLKRFENFIIKFSFLANVQNAVPFKTLSCSKDSCIKFSTRLKRRLKHGTI